MAEQELRTLLVNGEGPTVELKREFTLDIVREVVAFANTGGGTVLIGVDDDTSVVGVEGDPQRLEERIVGACRADVKPVLPLEVNPIQLTEGTVMVVTVPRGERRPYTARDVCYVRAGSSARRAAPEELRAIALEAEYTRYELTPVANSSIDDLDLVKFSTYIDRRSPGALAINGLKVEDLLVNLKLARREGPEVAPTVAGMVLFGRQSQQGHPQWEVGAIRVSGTDLSDPIADRADCRGTAVELVQQARAFALRNLRVAGVFGTEPDQAGRKDTPEYPMEAVEEAIVNAVVHRDYSSTARVVLRLFSDRWEITNPGGPPSSADAEALLSEGGISLPRNPTIAQVMREHGLGEQVGRGLIRIRRAMRDLGSEAPEFEVGHLGFRATLPSRHKAL